jgi:glycosyltransferase involved in cell wall biosynthesis
MTLRILMATPRYAPEVGGVQRCVEEVAKRLAARGCEVTVLTTDRNGVLPVDDEMDGVSVRRVKAWPARRDYYFAPGVVPVVSRGDWDIVHVQSYHTFVAPLAMAAALRRGAPYVVTFHGGGHSSRLRSKGRPAQIAALAPLLRRAERLVATARFEVDLFGRSLGLPPERFALIPNGGDLTRRPSTPPTPPVAPNATTTIASVGRLERYKGHHRIIAALPHIVRRRPDVRLWIAGSGSYERSLRELAARLGVADLVTIEAVPSGDPAALTTRLEQAALVVLLSEFETHPMAVLEAATLGRPLLLADSPGLRELADDGLGRAIALRSDPRAVAAAVLEELERPVEPAQLSLPTWDECADKHLELYESVLARKP